jgi:hypothetical protein
MCVRFSRRKRDYLIIFGYTVKGLGVILQGDFMTVSLFPCPTLLEKDMVLMNKKRSSNGPAVGKGYDI